MTPEQFAYWLQGFAELGAGQVPTQAQWDSICEHLNLVFKKETKAVAKAPVATDKGINKIQNDIHRILQEEAAKKAAEEVAAQQKRDAAKPAPVWPFPSSPGISPFPGIQPYPDGVPPFDQGKYILTC